MSHLSVPGKNKSLLWGWLRARGPGRRFLFGWGFRRRGLATLLILLCGVLSVATPLATAAEDASARELIFLNWSDYMDQDLIRKFQEKHGVTVRQVYYETEEELGRLLSLTGGKGYDVVLASMLPAQAYLQRKWLAPVDEKRIPNLSHIDPVWAKRNPELMRHAVPFAWGTMGIAYRRDLVPGEVVGWRQLLAPAEALRGKILMIKDQRDAIVPALKMLGYSLNSDRPEELDAAEKVLLAQKPFVKKYSYPSLGEDSELVSGEIAMALVYSGDAVALREFNADIAYAAPVEGTCIWLDSLLVMRHSARQELAMAFINFLNEPENGAQLAEYIYHATPNLAAKAKLPAGHLRNPAIWPDAETLARSEFYLPLPARVQKRYNTIYLRASEGLR
ncbi:ABC transporter substrate-binding protein [Thiovibrio sp. JS02]